MSGEAGGSGTRRQAPGPRPRIVIRPGEDKSLAEKHLDLKNKVFHLENKQGKLVSDCEGFKVELEMARQINQDTWQSWRDGEEMLIGEVTRLTRELEVERSARAHDRCVIRDLNDTVDNLVTNNMLLERRWAVTQQMVVALQQELAAIRPVQSNPMPADQASAMEVDQGVPSTTPQPQSYSVDGPWRDIYEQP